MSKISDLIHPNLQLPFDTIEISRKPMINAALRCEEEALEPFAKNAFRFETAQNPADLALIRRCLAWILEASDPEFINFECPASWWDHFRLACAPAWCNARWPPKMKRTEVKVQDLLPFPTRHWPESVGPVVRVAHVRIFKPWEL